MNEQKALLDLQIQVAQAKVREIGNQLSAAYAEMGQLIQERASLDSDRIKCQYCHDHFEPARLAEHLPICAAEFASEKELVDATRQTG